MKKLIALLLALCLLTAGCGKEQEAPEPPASTASTTQDTETTAPETTVPETTAPKTTETQVMGDRIPVIRELLEQGTTLEVMGYEETFAKVTAGTEEGLVEADFLRFPDEAFERRTAYALWNAGLYPDFSCLGEPLEKLATNTKLEVLEELEKSLYVRAGEQTGFVPLAQQSRYPYQPPADSGSGDSGGSGGSGTQDGGDITLMHPGVLRLLADAVKTGEAKVKVPGVPLVLRFCDFGDRVSVLEPGTAPEIPGYTAILESDGTTAYIPTAWLEGAETFTPWEGYAGSNCKLYEDYLISGKEVKTLYTNKPLTVLWDSGLTALVQVEGERFYAASSTLLETPLVITPAPENDSSGGGSSDLWTPPVL
mgnify:FL=1